MTIVSTDIQNNIAVLRIDNPPVNALSHAVRSGLSDTLKNIANNKDVKSVVIICKGRTFCAGADITEFGKPPVSPTLPELMDEIDSFNKPLIAAMHGTALGGGFEVALCCHYRIMDKGIKVGLPEVNLGLIPGAGGTQRLPRLIGAEEALDMITSGKPINAAKAFELGIADKISKNDLLADALQFAAAKEVRRISDLTLEAPAYVFTKFEKKIARRARGFLAPFAAIEAIKASTDRPFNEGIEFERGKFMELIASSHSKAQRHLFFAERAATKVPDIDKTTPVRDVKSVAVIGGGIMGCGIAVNFLNKGLPVSLLEISNEACNGARSKIRKIYNSTVKKGLMSAEKMEACLKALTLTSNYDDLSNTDLIIEAVFEDMDVKKQVFAKIDAVAKESAILATNTSFLDINEIASSISRPQDVIGLHFFSPAHIMPLLEIVRTDKNDPEIIATALKIGKTIGKTSVISGVCYGFIANRMSSCYGREAGLLLLEGALAEQVDNVLYKFGMPMGMFTMLDMAGIDIGVMARQKMTPGSYDERAFKIHETLVDNGQKGQKTGSGFYIYDPSSKTLNPEINELAVKYADEFGITRREISDKEIEERCIYALINEGLKIVEEGIALRASDVDVVYALGFGFPRYRGGPLHYGEHIGFDNVLKRINEFAKDHGDRWWKPSNMLIELAKK